mmetsp:Transcript_157431/g.279247  ORF Transcript_157431/g.279247 Transcript_157431/m.279247 type:complete len:183 (-) Transcript_157431:55-603(-)
MWPVALALLLVFQHVAASLRGAPQAVLKADLAQLAASHEATLQVISRADKEFEAAQPLLAEFSLFAKEAKETLPKDAPQMLVSLKTHSTALSKVAADLKATSATALGLYNRMLQEELPKRSKVLLRNLQHSGQRSFDMHRRLSETFDFKFKRAVHLITKAEKAEGKNLADTLANLRRLAGAS